MDLFAGKPTRQQIDFNAYLQKENEKLAKVQEEFLAKRTALMNSMTDEEWQEFLQAEMAKNIKDRASTTKQYEVR